ncbi:hypothetical protein HKX48_008107 [Thoreauomyces humboldtii]|nr:hypothetical protein HKX48_008107 [Thoreauomyces humboldtii]
MLGCYGIAFASGYGYDMVEDGADWQGRNYNLSDGITILGSYLLLVAFQSLLPAIRERLGIGKRWIVLLRALTHVLFGCTMGTYIITTGMIGWRMNHLRQGAILDIENVASVRLILFTIWVLYAALECIAIAGVVLKFLLGMKKKALGVSRALANDNPALNSVAILEKVRRRFAASMCICIPATAAMVIANAQIYSNVMDACGTLYASLFCTFMLYQIHVIRQIVMFSPDFGEDPSFASSSATTKPLASYDTSNRTQFTSPLLAQEQILELRDMS